MTNHKKKMEILEAVWRESSQYFKNQARQRERMMKIVSLNEYYEREKYKPSRETKRVCSSV
jgi:hypothetical protein